MCSVKLGVGMHCSVCGSVWQCIVVRWVVCGSV